MSNDVPSDLFPEILRRVPVESLFRIKTVCKSWCGIIDDPGFAKTHITRGLGDECLLIRNDYTAKISLVPLHHMISYPKKRTKAANMDGGHILRFPGPSCNGLILKTYYERNLVSSVWNKLVRSVWNPFTGEYYEIPKCVEYEGSYWGIGYDEGSDDYKVVNIGKPHTYIYSLRLRTWRRIEDFPNFDTKMLNFGVLANGALHWVNHVYDEDDEDDGYSIYECVVALDLSTETYRTIEFPLEFAASNTIFDLKLDALDETLFLSCYNSIEGFVVWMMNDYGCGNRWTKVITMQPPECCRDIFRPIAYLKNKDKVLFHIAKETFMWYDVGKNNKFYIPLCLDANEHIHHTFSYKVSRTSLVRFERRKFSID